MTKKVVSNKCHVSLSSNFAALMMVGAALSWFSIGASAQERTNSTPSIAAVAFVGSADLEKAFWICDHAATNHGVDGGMGIACGVITEDLKVRKFNGDFNLMLAWWRQNKAAEHQALATVGRPTASR
jgi:hypothetical protein